MSSANSLTVPNRTGVVSFGARESFRFRQQNAAVLQSGKGGGRFLTTSDVFVREMVLKHPEQFRVLEPRHTLSCVPREAWPTVPLEGRKLLFLLSGQALGDSTAAALALAAVLEQRRPAKIGVFCARSAADIFEKVRGIDVHAYWLPLEEAARADHVFDLGHVEALRDVAVRPVDMEGELLRAFGLAPATRFPSEARRLGGGKLRLGVLPLGSSPLRTLPVAATAAVAAALRGFGSVTVFLNRYQMQGRLYADALRKLALADLAIVDGLETIRDLMSAIEALDYAVFADSGPAHIAKLFATPGTAVYTSAPGEVLQGRFRNLARWQVPFSGPHCAAPCGLAKLRLDATGSFGCMGSLGTTLEALPKVAGAPQPGLVAKFFAAPVPCVAALAQRAPDLAAFVTADLRARLDPEAG